MVLTPGKFSPGGGLQRLFLQPDSLLRILLWDRVHNRLGLYVGNRGIHLYAHYRDSDRYD